MTRHTLKPCPCCGGEAVGTRERNSDYLEVRHTPTCLVGSKRGGENWHFNGELRPRQEWPQLFADWDAWAAALLEWAHATTQRGPDSQKG